MFQHTKQFCSINAKPRLCFHLYAGVGLNCTARSGRVIYYRCDCLTPTAAEESLHEIWLLLLNWERVCLFERNRAIESLDVNAKIAKTDREWMNDTAGNNVFSVCVCVCACTGVCACAGVVPSFGHPLTFSCSPSSCKNAPFPSTKTNL